MSTDPNSFPQFDVDLGLLIPGHYILVNGANQVGRKVVCDGAAEGEVVPIGELIYFLGHPLNIYRVEGCAVDRFGYLTLELDSDLKAPVADNEMVRKFVPRPPLASHPICGWCREDLHFPSFIAFLGTDQETRWKARCENPSCPQCGIVMDTLR